jgi:hypothetical protein
MARTKRSVTAADSFPTVTAMNLGTALSVPDLEGLFRGVFIVGIHEELDGFVKIPRAQRGLMLAAVSGTCFMHA